MASLSLFVILFMTFLLSQLCDSIQLDARQRERQRRRIGLKQPLPLPPLLLFPELPKWPDFGRTPLVAGTDELEREVFATARVEMDQKQIERALMEKDEATIGTANSDRSSRITAVMASPWQISLAAASAVSIFVLVTTNASLMIAGIVFVVVFVVANGDPLDEDNATGAVARQVGRMTIQSVESSKPKLKAIARAAMTDQEEIVLLKQRIKRLEFAKADLELWKERRTAVDENVSRYSLDELKDVARRNKLALGGTKSQLLMRILENGVELDF
jgi:hypothetical protein